VESSSSNTVISLFQPIEPPPFFVLGLFLSLMKGEIGLELNRFLELNPGSNYRYIIHVLE